jgi:hypothetical protein
MPFLFFFSLPYLFSCCFIVLFRFNLGSTVSLELVAKECPFNLTGADFYALCSDALLSAVAERIQQLEKQTIETKTIEVNGATATKTDGDGFDNVVVEQRHFMDALSRLTPSVSLEEMKHYKKLQQSFASSALSTSTATTTGGDTLANERAPTIASSSSTSTTTDIATSSSSNNNVPKKKKSKSKSSKEEVENS